MARFGTRARCAALAAFSLMVPGAAACTGATKPASSAADGTGAAEVGKPAPDLSVDTLNGKGKISITSLSGKIAVVDFWATWCGPCKQSFPKLEELSKKHGGRVEIIGVSVDDEKDGVAEWAKLQGATFAIGWDNGHAIANRWNVKTMPTTFILDASGTVRYIHASYHDDEPELIDKELLSLINEPTKAKSAVASSGADSSPAPSASASATAPVAASASPGEDATPPPDTTAVPTKKPGKKPPGKPATKKPAAKPKK